MALSDFFGSFAKLLGDTGDNSPGLCQFQAVVSTFFELASVLWASSIAFTMHQAFLRKNPSFSSSEVGRYTKRYHAVIWSFSLLFTLLPLTTDSFGDTGGWCWIKNATDMDHAWRYIVFYVWVWLAWGYSCYVYCNVRSAMQDAQEGADAAATRAQRAVMRRILFYPLVLVVAWAPASINRAYELFTDDSVMFLTILHAVFQGLYGFLNALVYGMIPAVHKRIRAKFCGAKAVDELVTRKERAVSDSMNISVNDGHQAHTEESSEEEEPEKGYWSERPC